MTTPGRISLLASALAAALLAVAPPVLALNGSCFFQAQGLNLNFGTLDPSNAVDVTAWTTAGTLYADTVGDCKVTMTISGDNGPCAFHAIRPPIPATSGH